MSYDYREHMKNDINAYIDQYVGLETYTADDIDKLFERLSDELWIEDSVTGNTTSYDTEEKCREYVGANLDLALESMEEFGVTLNDIPRKSPARFLDTTIRCWLLNECLYQVLEEHLSNVSS